MDEDTVKSNDLANIHFRSPPSNIRALRGERAKIKGDREESPLGREDRNPRIK
jgi:hypothetical protein